MSHKSGVIIISSLKQVPDIAASQRDKLGEIERRDEFTLMDRAYLAWTTFLLSGHE